MKKEREWLVDRLPNVKHLILFSTELCSIDNQLVEVLDQRIQRLDINISSPLTQSAQLNYIYFSNVQYINLL